MIGWDTMGCIKPLNEFLRDAEFHQPLALEGPVGACLGCGHSAITK